MTDDENATAEFFAMDPKGVVHRIVTQTIDELEAIENFRRQSPIHGYSVKESFEVESAIRGKHLRAIIGEQAHDIQYAFPGATGKIIAYDDAESFFGAIGYTGDLKDRCASENTRFLKDGWKAEGGWAYREPDGYRVELPGIVA
jgi:hypothetical protein